ncbi:hypothetical protein [Brevibacillus daliensis]|uniref:hypothetical protein n=1 Tax=Brevibacillus daliensis TaxID=2892995 RepID=UPI001E2B2EB9|nr:hypothetical protein [Brevibacillus daliensis]
MTKPDQNRSFRISKWRQIGSTIMKLADTFGVFACLYTVSRSHYERVWHNDASLFKRDTIESIIIITIWTRNNEMGQAYISTCDEQKIIDAFHQARVSATSQNLAWTTFQQLLKLEQSLPLFESSHTLSQELFSQLPTIFRYTEALHSAFLKRHFLPLLQTQLRITDEQIYACRSDGTEYELAIIRLHSRMTLPQNREGELRTETGSSMLTFDRALIDNMLNELVKQMYHLLRTREPVHLPSPLTKNYLPTDSLIWIDTEILAHLLPHALKIHPTFPIPFTLYFSSWEGEYGFTPYHQWAVPLPSLPCEKSTLQNRQLISNLLQSGLNDVTIRLDMPSLQTKNPFLTAEQYIYLDKKPAFILSGVEQLTFDKKGERFTLLPKHIHHISISGKPSERTFITGNLLTFLQSLAGGTGIGPLLTTHSTNLGGHSVSAPQLTLLVT